MVRDAESNAESDAKRRQLIESKNEIDSLIYTTEKSVTDNGDKLDAETKTEVEKAIAEAKEVKDGEDLDLINAKKEALSQASMKIGQAMYASKSEEGNAEGGDAENTQEAEFTEKEDEEKKDEEKKDEGKK